MLPRKIQCMPVRAVLKIIALSAERPDGILRFPINVKNRMEISSRDEIVA